MAAGLGSGPDTGDSWVLAELVDTGRSTVDEGRCCWSVTTLPVVMVTSGAPTTRTSGAIWSVTLRPSTFLLMV